MKVYAIAWLDSRGHSHWTFRDKVRGSPFDVISVGVIAKKTRRAITIAGTFGDLGRRDEQHHAPISIPRCAILSIVTIGRVTKGRFIMAKKSKYSPKAQKAIGSKMRAMKGEKKPHKQKVAIALNTARGKGLKVPKARKT